MFRVLDSLAKIPADSFFWLFDTDTLCGDPYGSEHTGPDGITPYQIPSDIFNKIWNSDSGFAQLSIKEVEKIFPPKDVAYWKSDAESWKVYDGTVSFEKLELRDPARMTLVVVPLVNILDWSHDFYILQKYQGVAGIIHRMIIFDKYGLDWGKASRKKKPDWLRISRANGASLGFAGAQDNFLTLNEDKVICLGNLQTQTHYNAWSQHGSFHHFFRADLLSSDPIRYKYYYNFYLYDTTANPSSGDWYEDSSVVTWKYDAVRGRILPDSGWKSFSPAKYFCYRLGENSDLLMMSHAQLLRDLITKDEGKKQVLFTRVESYLKYLWEKG